MSRIDVRKTSKLYIGGAFPRSESGYSYAVNDAKGRFVANAALEDANANAAAIPIHLFICPLLGITTLAGRCAESSGRR